MSNFQFISPDFKLIVLKIKYIAYIKYTNNDELFLKIQSEKWC